MYVWKVHKPCQKRKRDVIDRKEAVTTWMEHLEQYHQEYAIKVCLVAGAHKLCCKPIFYICMFIQS